MHIVKRIFVSCFVSCFAVFCGLGCGLAHASITPWIDFQIVDGFIVIPTEIHGIKGHSVIDTGAQFTGIAESFVKKNNLQLTRSTPQRILGVNANVTRKTYQDVPVTLMGAELVFGRLVDLDLGDRPQLLIGADFLRTLYFQFDYPNKRLRAISREAFDLKKLSNVKSRVDTVSRLPMVQVRLNDEKNLWLAIDTGNSLGLLIKRGVAQKSGWLNEYAVEKMNTRGVAGDAEMEMFRLPVLAIGPYNVRNASVVVPSEGEVIPIFSSLRGGLRGRGKVQGLLGYDVLKNFIVTFDYRTGSMVLELPEELEKGQRKTGG